PLAEGMVRWEACPTVTKESEDKQDMVRDMANRPALGEDQVSRLATVSSHMVDIWEVSTPV
ncbi:hypothetical protein BGZ79_000422, partial [Entomortierella chlamydospora]